MKLLGCLPLLALGLLGCFDVASTSSSTSSTKGQDILVPSGESYQIIDGKAMLLDVHSSCGSGGSWSQTVDTSWFENLGGGVAARLTISSYSSLMPLVDASGRYVYNSLGDLRYTNQVQYDTTKSYYGGGTSLENSDWLKIENGDTSIMYLKGKVVYRKVKDFCPSRNQAQNLLDGYSSSFGTVVSGSVNSNDCNTLKFSTVVDGAVKAVQIKYEMMKIGNAVTALKSTALADGKTCSGVINTTLSSVTEAQCMQAWSAYQSNVASSYYSQFYYGNYVVSPERQFDSCVSSALGVVSTPGTTLYRSKAALF